jgi:hypothetical protein
MGTALALISYNSLIENEISRKGDVENKTSHICKQQVVNIPAKTATPVKLLKNNNIPANIQTKLLPHINTYVSNNNLVIELDDNTTISTDRNIDLYFTTEQSGNITSLNESNIVSCILPNLGNINLLSLHTSTANIRLSETSKIQINASQKSNANFWFTDYYQKYN